MAKLNKLPSLSAYGLERAACPVMSQLRHVVLITASTGTTETLGRVFSSKQFTHNRRPTHISQTISPNPNPLRTIFVFQIVLSSILGASLYSLYTVRSLYLRSRSFRSLGNVTRTLAAVVRRRACRTDCRNSPEMAGAGSQNHD